MSAPEPPLSRRAAREASSSGRGGGRPRPQRGTPPPAPADADSTLSRRQIGIIAGASALIFLLLCSGAVAVGVMVGHRSADPVPVVRPSTSPTRIVPSDEVSPTAIPTCSIDAQASASNLITFYGSVVETENGTPLYDHNATQAERPASDLKVLTAAAAIAVLGPSFQITTSVLDGATPGSITLVGQGDATLSRLAAGQSVYGGAPTLSALATQALAAYNTAHPGVPITQIVLDSSYWDPTDNWTQSVSRSEQTGGYLSEATALQVDGDRQNPKAQVSPRGTDPVMTAGQAFVTALGLDPSTVTLTEGQAENGAPVLASVQSQPVSVLVKQMLLTNDDTLAEMLARIVSVKENLGGGSASIQQAITTALGKYGLNTSGLNIVDGSGESDESAVPPLYMSQFMSLVGQKNNGLQYVAAGIPLAGKTGGLVGRFGGPNSVGIGKIYAMPGSLSDAYTLTGYLTAADGTGESFTFYALGQGITSAAQASLDSLATAVYTCGKNITNN